MAKILLVEDALFFKRIIETSLAADGGFDVVSAQSYGEAEAILKEDKNDFFLALIDLTLPDAPDGEITNLCISAGIPFVVFSSRYDEKLRTSILKRGAVDYVVKTSPSSLNYLTELVQRLYDNRNVGALLVDDSPIERLYFSELLSRYLLNVFIASSADEAMEILAREPSIQVALVDHIMPGKGGLELLQDIRRTYPREELAILGLSGSNEPSVIAQFLKYGANDFLGKNCTHEELLLRVSQNLNMIKRLRDLTEAVNRDFLTGLHNRRYLLEHGEALLNNAAKEGRPSMVAILDIDHFKMVNDTYGHDAGDKVLSKVSQQLQEILPDDAIIARIGGEEFCIVATNTDSDMCERLLNDLREAISSSTIMHKNKMISVTISIGLCSNVGALEAAMQIADKHLYKAKETGRNRIVAA